MASRLQDVILRGLAADRPLSTDVAPGTLYYSTDTAITERCADDGLSWETYADGGGGGVPGLHATTHSSGGTDPVTVTNLAGYPGGTTTFLRADNTFAAPTSTSGLTLLEQHTGSGSASLNFTTAITSTYDEYSFEFVNIVPATNGASLYMKFSTDGGSTWQATNYNFLQYVLGASFSNLSEQLSQARVWLGGGLLSTASEGGLSGFMRLFDPLSTTIVKRFQVDTFSKGSSDSKYYFTRFIGQWSTSGTAVNAVQFIMDSGNVASGTIRCYGLAK